MPFPANLTALLLGIGVGLAGVLGSLGNFEVTAVPPPYHIVIREGNLEYPLTANGGTVETALSTSLMIPKPGDLITPSPDTALREGMRIVVQRPYTVYLAVDGQRAEVFTHARTVGDTVHERGILLGVQDRTEPDQETTLRDGMRITVIRVEEVERVEQRPVPFDAVTKDDPDIPWGRRVIEQGGKLGMKEVTLGIHLENGIETRRTILAANIVEEAQPEVVRIGTQILVGSKQSGFASWYQFGRKPTAASTSFPRGTYLRVTNQENGASVIVLVNDYGPVIPGRIIDLNSVAFKALAPLSQGLIPVLVEEIL